MKYYLHDTNSFQDEKVTELFMKFGYEGLGLFYTILEKLALQEKPVKTDVLKKQLFIGKRLNKCWSFMEEIGIISSNNSETFNKQLLKFSEKYQVKKEKNAKRISQWRKNQVDSENVTRYEHVCNTPKVKESKVKESKVNNIKETFNFRKELLNLNIEKQIVEDWLKVRLRKKASNTLTAFKKIKKEIELSELTANECIEIAVEKDWRGFEYSWLKPKTNGQQNKTSIKDNNYPTDDEYKKDAASW